MRLVEKCWMVTSKISVIALLMITGIYFGKFVCPYIKKKKGGNFKCHTSEEYQVIDDLVKCAKQAVEIVKLAAGK